MKTKFHTASDPIRRLTRLQKYFPGAIIAGGALRDDYMKMSDHISDYDIFVKDIFFTGTNVKTMEEMDKAYEPVQAIFEKVFPLYFEMEQLFESEYLTKQEKEEEQDPIGSHAHISNVWNIEEDGMMYQVIFTKLDPIQHVNKYFDLGFCKTYCDGVKIRYTDDFLRDVNNKTMTVVGEDMTKEQVEYAVYHHAEKLFYKYDNFKVVVPPKYQPFLPDYPFPF